MPKTKFVPGDVLRWDQSKDGRGFHKLYGEPFLVLTANGDTRMGRYTLEGLEGTKLIPGQRYSWCDNCFVKDEFLSAVKHATKTEV